MEHYTDPFQYQNKILTNLVEKVDDLTEIVKRVTNPQVSDLTKPFGVSEAADFLGVTIPTMYGLHWEKKVRAYKVGKKLYFFPSDLLEYIRSGKEPTADDLDDQARDIIQKRRTRRTRTVQAVSPG
jgi:excisionase family DNA binding protein